MRFAELAGRRVAIWGAGIEGRAAQAFLERHAPPAALAVVTDADPVVRDAALDSCEIVVKSPGVSPYRDDVRSVAARRRVTGGTALWFAETSGNRTIGVTGSKGKSTTSSLIAHVFGELAGAESVAFGGNVGRALLDLLDADICSGAIPASRWNVLELSSFQTAEVQHSPEVGVLTALFPEHLDWHLTVERYYADKCNLFAHRASVVTVANAANPNVAARLSDLPNVLPYGVAEGIWPGDDGWVMDGNIRLLPSHTTSLVGRHNLVNLCGALTALRAVGFDLHAEQRTGRLAAAVASFRPLEHRLQSVGEVEGRLVVDDGLSTAPEAAIAALAAFAGRAVSIIVGGHDRNLEYDRLAEALARRPTPTLVLGVPESGSRIVALINEVLSRAGNSIVHAVVHLDFDDAVEHALADTPVGGVILLSPGAPSFGRFANYADRSRHFRQLVGLGG